jgi:hypothetical protein
MNRWRSIPGRFGRSRGRGVVNVRRVDQVFRTALVKPAMNSAANAHASSCSTQPAAISQAAVALAEFWVRSQSARAYSAGLSAQGFKGVLDDRLGLCSSARAIAQ